jgi:hypothetical protein
MSEQCFFLKKGKWTAKTSLVVKSYAYQMLGKHQNSFALLGVLRRTIVITLGTTISTTVTLTTTIRTIPIEYVPSELLQKAFNTVKHSSLTVFYFAWFEPAILDWTVSKAHKR